MQICFVCLGNICRSPTAEGIMAAKLAAAGLADVVGVDSAGTGGWHRGAPADDRARTEAARRGITLTSRARQVHAGDFAYFDLLVAMDRDNRADLLALAPDAEAAAKVRLLRSFTPNSGPASSGTASSGTPVDEIERPDKIEGLDEIERLHEIDNLDVPDPYYGGPNGFADVFDIIDAACTGLLDHIRAQVQA